MKRHISYIPYCLSLLVGLCSIAYASSKKVRIFPVYGETPTIQTQPAYAAGNYLTVPISWDIIRAHIARIQGDQPSGAVVCPPQSAYQYPQQQPAPVAPPSTRTVRIRRIPPQDDKKVIKRCEKELDHYKTRYRSLEESTDKERDTSYAKTRQHRARRDQSRRWTTVLLPTGTTPPEGLELIPGKPIVYLPPPGCARTYYPTCDPHHTSYGFTPRHHFHPHSGGYGNRYMLLR